MLKITGKLASGQIVSGNINTEDYAEAAEAAEKASTDSGSPLVSLTIKGEKASNGLKVLAARKRKTATTTATPAETPAPAAPSRKR